jgi:pimeloyl-ACP methyl ester carboxylesterase
MFNEIRDSTVNQIKSLLSSQRDKKFKGITIFGHSMGAAVGSLLSRELTKNKIEGLPVNLVTLGIPPLSNPAIPESELADSIYHLYIPGDIVYDLVQFTEFKHPGGRKIPLRGTGIKDIFRHCVSDYHNLYLEMTDTCKLT